MPEAWKPPQGCVDVRKQNEVSYAQYFTHFRVVNHFGLLSLWQDEYCTIRFSLDAPEDFDFLPAKICSSEGPLMQEGSSLYICENTAYAKGFYATEVDGSRLGATRRLISEANFQKYIFTTYEGWWRQGPLIFVGELIFDMRTEKFSRWTDHHLFARDFAEDGKGGVYVLENHNDLYHFPKDWYRSGEDRAKYRIASLES